MQACPLSVFCIVKDQRAGLALVPQGFNQSSSFSIFLECSSVLVLLYLTGEKWSLGIVLPMRKVAFSLGLRLSKKGASQFTRELYRGFRVAALNLWVTTSFEVK